MEKITLPICCELCTGNIIKGRVKKAPSGYICESCIEHIACEDFQEVDAQNEYLAGSPTRLK